MRRLSSVALAVVAAASAIWLARREVPEAARPSHLALTDTSRTIRRDGVGRILPISIGRSLRRSIVAPSLSRLTWSFDSFEWDRLLLDVGATREAPIAASADFELRIRVQQPPGTVALEVTEALRLGSGERETGWRSLSFDLSGVTAGGPAVLSFDSRAARNAGRVVWGAPTLLASRAESALPDVFLVSLDTTAAEHLSLYRYGRLTSPSLEALARDAVTFDQAITAQTWTLTAHASMMTSQYPDTHRVSFSNGIASGAPLLPDLLRRLGFHSVGLVNNPYLNPSFGYARGYDIYDYAHTLKDDEGDRVDRTAAESHTTVETWFDRGLPRPLFFFYHLIDPHSDWRGRRYEAPPPFDVMFGGADEFGGADDDPSRRETDAARAQYDGSIAYTDHYVGRFLDLLREKGRYDDALIIVTSDHGEEFRQHGELGHRQGYDEVLRVPLLIKFPRNEGGGTRVSAQVSVMDLLPTVFDVLGVDQPARVEGRSLAPAKAGGAIDTRLIIAKANHLSMTPHDVYVARDGRWKLHYWPEFDRVRLFDLHADPRERIDLSKEQPIQLRRLMTQLQRHRRERDSGFRLRVPGFDGPGFSITLTTDSEFVAVEAFHSHWDQQLPRPILERTARELRLHHEGAYSSVAAAGIDFDLAAGASELVIEVTIDGRIVRPDVVRLGAGQTPASAMPLRMTPGANALRSRRPGGVKFGVRAGEFRVLLWESRAELGAGVVLDETERRRLESLGYVGRRP